MYSRITILLLAILYGPPFWVQLQAEGTNELIPSGSSSSCISYIQGGDGSGKEGSGFNRPWYDLIYVHIEDPSKEVIYYGFTRLEPVSQEVYYRIIAPDGSILIAGKVASSSSDSGYVADNGVEAYRGPKVIAGGSGYDQLTCTPTIAGDYAIVFNVGDPTTINTSTRYYIHPFDVTVADASGSGKPDPIPGRLFSYKWHLNTNSGSNKACMDFYTYTPDSLVIRMDMNEIEPYGFTVSFNSHGADSTGDIEADRKSTNSISSSVPSYPIFLNEPDEDAYPTGTPGTITYLDIAGCHADENFCIEVNTTKVGEINVYIDLNGNGVYEEGTEDRYFPFTNSTSGVLCIPWDGLDGLGNPVTAGDSGTVIVQFLAGVVHFPIYDAENHPNGFDCAMIRPTGYTPLMYFDNRDVSIGTSDLDGCSSGCNPWSGNDGDKLMVNTWINTITSSDTATFSVDDLCPPAAVNDTACTAVGIELQLAILFNDSDSDNSLDPAAVTLSNISNPSAVLSYDTLMQILRYTPGVGEDTLTLDYQVCDSTSAIEGGPLCDDASILITVYDGCVYASVLGDDVWRVRVHNQPPHVRINWNLETEHTISKYVVERALPDREFAPLESRTCGEHLGFIDMGVQATNLPYVRYRIKALLTNGAVAYSPIHRVNLTGSQPAWAEASVSQNHSQVSVNYLAPEGGVIQITDIRGQVVFQNRLNRSLRPEELIIPASSWASGIYLVQVIHHDWTVYRKKILIQRQ